MNNKYLTWNEHPLNAALKNHNQTEIKKYTDFYLEQFQRSGFLTKEEIQTLQLIPYTDIVTTELLKKTEIELHKLIFRCQEKDFRPMILRTLIEYSRETYRDGCMRRVIYRLIMDAACHRQQDVIKGYAYKGCISGKLIHCFHLDHLYHRHPYLINALKYTRLDRSMFKEGKD